MIKFKKKILENGLTVICNEDKGTPFVSVNILYKVGSINENKDKTGFAHLFEHLMFSGSKNVNNFDQYVQLAGGESNAFTTNDYTNFYITIPAANIETALWLESDRMLNLTINKKSLDIQKSVVSEEFKQRYLNQPYGDIWLKLKPLAYKKHPYLWPTIGKSIKHIEDATLEDVNEFYNNFYAPNNAILAISGNINEDRAIELVNKWFGDIPRSNYIAPLIPSEPKQTEARKLVVKDNDVPASIIFKIYHMGPRMSQNFYDCDIISDLLSNGQSARLYVNLIQNSKIFSEIDAYVTGDVDPGLFIFRGKLSENSNIEEADLAIESEIHKFINNDISNREIQKIKNKAESKILFSEISYQSKAGNLALFEFMGNVDMVNEEVNFYESTNIFKIKECAKEIFNANNCSTLLYLKK